MYAAMRFWRFPAWRQALLLHAAVNLVLASVGLALLPFRQAIQLGSVRVRRGTKGRAEDVIWAIEAIARRVPWRAVCIHKGLAAQRMLRRRGVNAMLHYGIGHGVDAEGLKAHVWVSVEGTPLIGGDEARTVAAVGTFP